VTRPVSTISSTTVASCQLIDFAGRTDDAFGLAARSDFAGRTDDAFGLAARSDFAGRTDEAFGLAAR
jgi:hypothetical protein